MYMCPYVYVEPGSNWAVQVDETLHHHSAVMICVIQVTRTPFRAVQYACTNPKTLDQYRSALQEELLS